MVKVLMLLRKSKNAGQIVSTKFGHQGLIGGFQYKRTIGDTKLNYKK